MPRVRRHALNSDAYYYDVVVYAYGYSVAWRRRGKENNRVVIFYVNVVAFDLQAL